MRSFRISSLDLQFQMSSKHVFNQDVGGENISPHLKWDDAPEGTNSYIICCYDPDTPAAGVWWHWCVANIPSTTTEFESGITNFPEGCLHGLSDFGSTEYAGACPPKGDPPHNYNFCVCALSVPRLNVKNGTHPEVIMYKANKYILDRATIISQYSR